MKRSLPFLMIALAALAGCREIFPPPAPSPANPPPAGQAQQAATSQPAPTAPPGRLVTFVDMRMVVLELPLGSISRSGDIWNYLNEEPVVTAGGNALTANGIRIGIGRSGDWPELSAILTGLSGRELKFSQVILRADAPVPVVLQGGMPLQTIFLYNANRTLSGSDYPPGDNVLVVTGLVSMKDQKTVLLTANLAIRQAQRQVRYEKSPEGFALASEQPLYPLPGMQFQLSVPPGGIVVIAPSSQAARATSPGHQFLLRQHDGIESETVLVLLPLAVSSPLKEGL